MSTEPKIELQVTGFTGTMFESPQVNIRATQKHLNGESVESFTVRLGETIRVDELFAENKKQNDNEKKTD